MSSEIERIFFSTMPNSDLFLIQDNPEDVTNFDIVEKKLTTTHCHHHEIESLSNTSHSPITFDSLVLKPSLKIKDLSLNLSQSQNNQNDNTQSHSQTPKEEEEKEEDGFKTPTSLDHKIPEAKQCPPAPRKPKPKPSLKRKSPHTHTHCSPLLDDLSEEAEILLFPFQHNSLSNSHQVTKKVRRHHTN